MNFNDQFMDNLEYTDLESVLDTHFLKVFYEANWKKYQRLIIQIEFIPFILYLISMQSFYIYALKEETYGRIGVARNAIYFPSFGCCFLFTVHLALSEIVQMRHFGVL